ncbi:hypothetical protein N7491_000088 [Penicillium cf. griseofulvum]|uniref:Uncharacterized protein n=1 Tax=Penicillium cf. griseofulvum TaxID=2972120 RepID=A0A9W9JNN6_9EURO|nr:hypothetical protein N7472_004560 [Penicillium cf. griseofulvum]KAJ5442122.1 hypothetical protein N7445_005129 [Penicillium cf. griseofulvum]KAJ5450906.1 hypothetical protein N7491_000088 [Penicillium cf. griseofulvum]
MNPISDPVPPKSCSNFIVGKRKALHETQDGTNGTTQSSKGVAEGSKASNRGSKTNLEAALNKFFGGPPFCLIVPEFIEDHTGPMTRKRARSRVQPSPRGIVTWVDVLSAETTLFKLQENGMYHCHVKGRLIELSAENYRFIQFGYPQRMMQ